ncbi:MAG: hypothetical protein K2P59_16915 [Acetatifactor sp.]|nr:hypothetical protein [Acetatifactor sp.]
MIGNKQVSRHSVGIVAAESFSGWKAGWEEMREIGKDFRSSDCPVVQNSVFGKPYGRKGRDII